MPARDKPRYAGIRSFISVQREVCSRPESANSTCRRANAREALGHKARLRLRDLLNAGTIRIVKSGNRDEDRYGRKLRLVTVNGRSVGDILIEEGLAWPWEGRRHDWCRGAG
jgi:endonuclease YncB( thermonuclease family)